ncbi:SRPBCC family protein [Actinomadura roseirufa]|uniref:SRPBCC family protein n=1 Tax=Actinomadura roseirufa TaxID=2094049 RepID=UPI001041530D|nr:SRPBCC domain-containing protein [Actinomadura roseirufa]
MGKEFEIVREFEVDAAPEQVWDALTTGTAGWLWPMEYEPREGGAAPAGGVVTDWDPPHRLAARGEWPEAATGQSLNRLDQLIEPREGGRAWVRWVHSGIFVDDWDNQYDAAARHTDFYLHTLVQYLTRFQGRPVTHSGVQGPEASRARGSFEAVVRALGLGAGVSAGDETRVDLPGTGPADVVVDYRDELFVGLRTGDAMYRFFGRDAFGAPVAVVVHQFAADAAETQKATQRAWQGWLDRLYS